MTYLLDRKQKWRKIYRSIALVLGVLILFYFRAPLSRGLASASQFIFHPILVGGKNAGNKISNVGLVFSSKKSLNNENIDLKLQLSLMTAKMANYDTLLDENTKLKEILGRVENRQVILAAILAKPNHSPYDTLLVDAGSAEGIEKGRFVYAGGDIPIGKISEVYPDTAKVILFSAPGEKTEVLISGKDIFMQLVGRGGGNFEMILPRDLTLEKGAEVQLPGLAPHVLASVVTILSDPRDAYQKALLVSPVNIQELKFVEVEI